MFKIGTTECWKSGIDWFCKMGLSVMGKPQAIVLVGIGGFGGVLRLMVLPDEGKDLCADGFRGGHGPNLPRQEEQNILRGLYLLNAECF